MKQNQNINDKPKPFGTYKLSKIREWMRKNAVQWQEKNKVVASVMRRIAGLRNPKGPIDIMPFGNARVRLYPNENLADKKCLRGINAMGKEVYEAIRDIIKKLEGRDFDFVDIGANTGIFLLVVNHAAQEFQKRVYNVAVEPNPVIIPRLKFNLSNSAIGKITAVKQCAVSDTETNLTLDTSNKNLGKAKIIDEDSSNKNTFEVEAKMLTTIIEETRLKNIDILKIDVEGHEIQALKPFFQNASEEIMPKFVFTEISKETEKPLTQFFEENGYKTKQKFKNDMLFEKIK